MTKRSWPARNPRVGHLADWVTQAPHSFLFVCLAFTFQRFDYGISWCWFLWDPLIWNSLCFLDLDVCFLLLVREISISAIIFSNKISIPFSFSLGSPMMQMLVHLMLSHKFLRLSSLFFFILFSFAALIRWAPLFYLQVNWSFLLLYLIFCWNPLVYFSAQFLYSSALWLQFYIFHLFVDILTAFVHSYFQFGEYLYYYYLKLFIK